MPRSRITWLTLAVLAMCAALGRADEASAPPGPAWFSVGEELVYDIHWGVFGVGETHATTEWTELDGQRVIRIRYVTKTNGILSTLYPVDDLIESLVDPVTFLPIRFTKRLKEGHYRCDETTDFDFAKLKASWQSRTNGRKKEFAIEPDTRDVVTFMYYLRAHRFETGQKLNFRVMADEKLYDLMIAVGKRLVLKIPPFGEVPSIRLDPEAAFQGLFVRSGKVVVWVSDDDRQVCTRLMVSVPVANVRLTLEDVRGPGSEAWSRNRSPQRDEYRGDARTDGLTENP